MQQSNHCSMIRLVPTCMQCLHQPTHPTPRVGVNTNNDASNQVLALSPGRALIALKKPKPVGLRPPGNIEKPQQLPYGMHVIAFSLSRAIRHSTTNTRTTHRPGNHPQRRCIPVVSHAHPMLFNVQSFCLGKFTQLRIVAVKPQSKFQTMITVALQDEVLQVRSGHVKSGQGGSRSACY